MNELVMERLLGPAAPEAPRPPRLNRLNRHTRRALVAIGRRMERAFNGVGRSVTRAAAQPYIHRYTKLLRRYKAQLGQL
jgi:hypothetical protein